MKHIFYLFILVLLTSCGGPHSKSFEGPIVVTNTRRDINSDRDTVYYFYATSGIHISPNIILESKHPVYNIGDTIMQ